MNVVRFSGIRKEMRERERARVWCVCVVGSLGLRRLKSETPCGRRVRALYCRMSCIGRSQSVRRRRRYILGYVRLCSVLRM